MFLTAKKQKGTIHTYNQTFGNRCESIIEKPVKVWHGPATVKQSKSKLCHWETGKAGGALKLSQENCLFIIHHLTYER